MLANIMPNEGTNENKPLLKEELNPLFRYGANKRLELKSRGVDESGRLWGRGVFFDNDDQPAQVAGYLSSLDMKESQESIGIMVFGWTLTEINNQKLEEAKYLLADVAEIKLADRQRILSKSGYEEVMRELAIKNGKGSLTRVPKLNIFSLKKKS